MDDQRRTILIIRLARTGRRCRNNTIEALEFGISVIIFLACRAKISLQCTVLAVAFFAVSDHDKQPDSTTSISLFVILLQQCICHTHWSQPIRMNHKIFETDDAVAIDEQAQKTF